MPNETDERGQRVTKRRERRPQFARVIFYNADMGMISPVVSNDWERPVEWLLQKSEAMFTTNIPDAACARFIGWYLARPWAGESHLGVLGVDNLPVPVWQPHGDGAAAPAGERGRSAREGFRVAKTTDEPPSDEVMGSIRGCAGDALAVLGLDATADPATLVKAADDFAYRWQKGERPPADVVEDTEQAR